MKGAIRLAFLVAGILGTGTSRAQDGRPEDSFSRHKYYQAMNSRKKALVEDVLGQLQGLPEDNSQMAMEGALLMKQAQLLDNPVNKLSIFKKGHLKLEAAIHQDSVNVEWRFLRLMIQENCPAFLGYHDRITQDADEILREYPHLPKSLQQEIALYSKQSVHLKTLEPNSSLK